MATPYTQEEIEGKSADFVIHLIQALEDYYPDEYRELIEKIQEGVY